MPLPPHSQFYGSMQNAQLVKITHIELSMQDKINVCSKKSLAQCMPVTDDCAELYSIRKIQDWLDQAETVVDPEEDVELGLRVPSDEYLSFADGAPVFTGTQHCKPLCTSHS